MAYRKYLLILVLLFASKVSAQENSYQQADSISNSQYLAGEWKQLIAFGNQNIASGTDFPALRLRMAYAFFITQNYAAALQQYDEILANDTYNQTARYYAYWCNRYLNRYQEANYHASFIDKKLLKDYKISSGLIFAGLENSLKFPETAIRNAASYNRAFLGNRFGWRLQAEESVAYYNQSDNIRAFRQQNNYQEFDHDQFEYYQKLSYSLNSKWTILGAYHFVHSSQANHASLLGLKFTNNKLEWQGSVNYSYLNNLKIFQYNAKLNWYPLGNLNFYTVSTAVLQSFSNNQHFVFNQLIGGKISENVWMEGFATFGRQDNYLEADALYVYNYIDVTRFKTGATVYLQLNQHVLLPLTYMFERKNNNYQNLNYNQHSITAALLWRF